MKSYAWNVSWTGTLGMLLEWKTLAQNRETWASAKCRTYMEISLPMQLWLCIHVPQIRKTLTNVFPTQRTLFWVPPMVENSPLDVSAWISGLGPDFKDSLAPYGLFCIFPYHQIKVDKPLLRAVANYWLNRRLMISSSLPWVGIFILCCELCWASLLPRQIGGVSLASSSLVWSLSIFPVRHFLRVKGHTHTFFTPFAYLPWQGISWFKSHIVCTFECAWWLMS